MNDVPQQRRRRWMGWRAGLIWMLMLIGTGWGMAGAAESEALIKQAQQAFNQGHYPEAVKAYEQLSERAPHDARVLYNLGTAYARAGQPGLAVWRYLQAYEHTPRDPDLRDNLRTLDPNIYENMALTPLPPVNWLYRQLSANEWTAVAGGATLLAFALGALYFLRLRRGALARALRPLMLGLFGLAALTWPFALAHDYVEDHYWRAVVVTKNAVARTGPSETQIETYPLPLGTIIRIRDDATTPGWVKFSYAGGRVGYLEKAQIRYL